MSNGTVLIVAYSARALAQSARRAGYVPLVADAFGDLDTQDAAEHFVQLPHALQRGFDAKTLIPALDALAAKAASAPIGLVTGSGFEDRPRLLHRLDQRFGLLGTPASEVRDIKHAAGFAQLCQRLAIPHPEVSLTPPERLDGWLSKRTGGTGGGHVRHAADTDEATKRRYFQRELRGTSASLFAIFSGQMFYAIPTRQWCVETPDRPFRYGGAMTVSPASDVAGQMQNAASKLHKATALGGIISLDFRIVNDTAYLLEVNPRPGATLDLFDSIAVPLFQSHIDACKGDRFDCPPPVEEARLSAIAYAERPVTVPNLNWPHWAADRTRSGTIVSSGQPLATLFATASTPDAAEALGRERLATLQDLIYGHSK